MLWTYSPSGVVPEEPAAAHCYAISLSKWSGQSCQLHAPKRRLHPVSTNNYVSIPRQIQQVDLKHELIRYVLLILAFWNSLSTLQKCFSEAHVYHWFSRADLNNFQVAVCFKSGHQFFNTINIKLKTHLYEIILHFKDLKSI